MNFLHRKLGATLGLALVTVFTIALPASAATVGEWAKWDGDSLNFSNSNMSDATYTVSNYDESGFYSPADEGEGFSATTPIGSIIGANATSSKNLFLKVVTIADNTEIAVVTITFDTATPADNLVLALSDVDSDQAVIEMTDGNAVALTGAEIIGTATDTGFNFEDLTSSDHPTVVAGASSVTIDDAPDGTDGATGWVRPNVAVKTITISISTEDGAPSSQRIWIGQLGDEELAPTGSSNSLYLVAFAGAAILAAAGIVRRRTH